MSTEKQMIQIWEAIRRGGGTSVEIAEMTGLSVAHVCNYLPDLIACGLVRFTGYVKRSDYGRALKCYEPARDMDWV